jgi:hypothetical protein
MNEDIKEPAKIRAETYRDTLIFWAVLVFTCVVGIIALLPEINIISNLSLSAIIQQICLGIIYFALLGVMVFSIWRVLGVYKDGRELALSGSLGKAIERQAKTNRTSMDKFIDRRRHMLVSKIAISFMFIVFVLLYLTKTGLFDWICSMILQLAHHI